MKTIVRLNSVIPNGVGSGPESAAIDLIYSFLLREFKQNKYRQISINQIGYDLEEFITTTGDKIYINVRYPVVDEFNRMSENDKNIIRLDVIHDSLIRIANHEKKLDPKKLEEIKELILLKDFLFEFDCKSYPNKKYKNLNAKIILQPLMTKFNYYLVVEDAGVIKCKVLIYSGIPVMIYFSELFSIGKWNGDNEIIISGKNKEVEITLSIDECILTYVNLTKFEKPPYFEMMRADLPEFEKRKAYFDWVHSLPPGHAAILNFEPN
jgi:hypothetical protein